MLADQLQVKRASLFMSYDLSANVDFVSQFT